MRIEQTNLTNSCLQLWWRTFLLMEYLHLQGHESVKSEETLEIDFGLFNICQFLELISISTRGNNLLCGPILNSQAHPGMSAWRSEIRASTKISNDISREDPESPSHQLESILRIILYCWRHWRGFLHEKHGKPGRTKTGLYSAKRILGKQWTGYWLHPICPPSSKNQRNSELSSVSIKSFRDALDHVDSLARI